MSERCSWCDAEVDEDEGFRAIAPEGRPAPAPGESGPGGAVFCRLDHVVPWIMQGPDWAPAELPGDDDATALGVCARCGDDLGAERVLLVRHCGVHRIADAFCSTEHLLEWARRGGRWPTSR